MQIQETPQLQSLFNITMEHKQIYSLAIQQSNNHQFFALQCSPFMYILDKQGQILHFIQSFWMSSCFSDDSKYIAISCFQDEIRFIILYDLVENKKKWIKEISNLHIRVQLHFYFQSIIIASNYKIEMYTVDGRLEKFKGIYCKFDSNNIKINNEILLSCGSRFQHKYLFFLLSSQSFKILKYFVHLSPSQKLMPVLQNFILRNVSLGKILRKFQCTNNFNKQVIIKHIFINIQGNQLFQYNLISGKYYQSEIRCGEHFSIPPQVGNSELLIITSDFLCKMGDMMQTLKKIYKYIY